MPVSIVLLVITSALAHAAWNAILKRSKDAEHAIVGMMMICGACSVVTSLILDAWTPMPGRTSVLWSLVSGLLEAGYFVTLARALVRAPLGSVYTVVRGGALVLVWPVSVVLLGEELTASGIAGTCLVVLGLAAAGASDRSTSSTKALLIGSDEAVGAARVRSGIAIAAFCAVFVAGYHLAYKLALSNGGRPEAVVSISICSASAINIMTLGPARRRLAIAALRAEPIRATVGGILGSVGFLIFLFAMKNAGAGSVLTLRNTSILFAQVMAFALGERPKRLGIIGAVLVTVGAVLLAR